MNPGKIEICDSKDNNCNGQIDEDDVCVFVSAKVAAGGSHTCAIKTNGSLWCWGNNTSGQLGDGTNINKNKPVYIMSLGSRGGGAPFIFFGDKSSFDNREEKQANMGQKQTIYGCSSVNVTFYII
jgi:alpha-tubulin suppressor-like RCC1 family protein